MKKSDNTFDEDTKEWLKKRSQVYALVIQGVSTFDNVSVSQENMIDCVVSLDKEFCARSWWIEHHHEPLKEKEQGEKREQEKNELRLFEIERGWKPFHYHWVLWLPNSQTRLGEVLRYICDKLGLTFDCDGIPNPAVQIQTAKTPPIGIIRYLMHLDDKDKKPFDRTDVRTNDPEYLEFCIQMRGGYLNADNLCRCIAMCCGNKMEVMHLVGIDYYQRYRMVIHEIIKEGGYLPYL